jgi:ribonuclease BN (tRNA processing enzyme)
VLQSHLHFDHTGGLFAVLGLRMQLEVRGKPRVLGPPGTRTLVDGLLAASAPAMRAAYGIPGQAWGADIEVVELTDGGKVAFEGFELTAAANSHFSLPAGDAGEPAGGCESAALDARQQKIERLYVGFLVPFSLTRIRSANLIDRDQGQRSADRRELFPD